MRYFFFFILAASQLNFLESRVRKIREENYCKVREQEFSQEFDFTVLTNPDEDYSIQHDTDVILRLQPCNVLLKSCNDHSEYSICLSKNGQEIGIGKSPPEVVHEFGEIIFKYTGDQCDKQGNYTVDIKMKCDFRVKEANAGIELYAAGYNDCNFKMEWRTSAACTEPTKVSCTVDNKSDHYDLSALTKLSGNYEVFINEKKKVLLNVCHSIIYGQNTCKSSNAACLIELGGDDKSNSKPLGEPQQNLQYNADGTLTLKYTEGAMCPFNVKTQHMQTTITFICDLNAIGTLPHYVGGMELCDYRFNWTVAAACSEQALHNKSLEKNNSDICTVKNPITGQIFNLTALMNKEFSVRPFGTNELYKFNICNGLLNTTCQEGTGACKLHRSVSCGIGNSNLMWKESGPYLNYTNGDLCLRKKQRYTVIEFSCGPEDYEIEENDLCYDEIKFSTPLACKKQETCSSYNNQVNLTPLMLQLSNYVIKSGDVEYHINLCQSLIKDHKLGVCIDKKASICKTRINNGKVISTTNLGSFDTALVTSSDRSAILIYHNGSACAEDKKRSIESSISFLCDIKSQMSQPQFTSYSNCTYFFEWKTSLVCGKVDDGYFNANCSINNTLGDFRNLSLLGDKNGLVTSVVGENNKLYRISLCGDRKECKGGFICDDNTNYGTSLSILYDYTESPDIVRFHFTGGDKCKDGSLAQSVLSINCKDNYISNAPVLLKETPCYLEFEWDRAQICRFLRVSENSISTDDTKHNIALNETNSLNGGAIAGIAVAIIIVVIVIFYLQNESRRTHLIDMISNSTSRNCDRVKYSRVNTMEEVHLLLNESDPTVIESESDDDELLDA